MRRGGLHDVTMMAENLPMSGEVGGVRADRALDQLPQAGVGTGRGGSVRHRECAAAIVTILDAGHEIKLTLQTPGPRFATSSMTSS